MKYAFITLLLVLSSACTLQKEAFIFIDGKSAGRTNDGLYYLDVKVKNSGEQPGYFVILIAQAYQKGQEVQRIEKGYGDVFPNATKEMRLIFDRIGVTEPDSVSLNITYSPYQL